MRLLSLLALAVPTVLLALPPTGPIAPEPDPAPADGTKEALKQIGSFRLPAGLKAELFAAEPMLASPVAIGLDEKNRVFVAEEFRFNRGTQENRNNAALPTLYFLDDDLQIRTLDDRRRVFEKWKHKFPGGMDWYSKKADQLRLVQDMDGDGRADKSTVFAGGFNAPLDGLAAGVMAFNGDVYFTCIPSLYRLRDKDGDGMADERLALLTGFGVNLAFLGHDLHGLAWGPDGKLYFSVGDRGFNVTTKEGATLSGPRTGAVFRCDPDGASLEVVHRGLRNPQELAFDQHGNLFADDNNCDKGDHARLVYMVEGGESGWNMAYQTIPAPYMSGPWFAERLWHLHHPGQAAYILPPVGPIGTGPGGFLFTSGTSLPDKYLNTFLMCNFTGNGGLESFRVSSKGAGFEIKDYEDFLKPIRATDCEFGADGKLYVSDFVNLDWTGKSMGGRIYTVADPAKLNSPVVQETKRLFAEGFGKRSIEELIKLHAHPDQKVRQRAQFVLVDRGKKDMAASRAQNELAHDVKADPLARLHAIWGTAQRGNALSLAMLLGDSDAEVRAQTANVLGWKIDDKVKTAAPLLEPKLTDPSPRVRFFAAQTLGKMRHRDAIPALFDLLKETKDTDPYLRHACILALSRIGDAAVVTAKTTDPNADVRLAAVLVLRRLADGSVSRFLADSDPLVRAEAARAVHDLPMEEEYPALAGLLPTLGSRPAADQDATARRAISAAYRLGTPDNARSVLSAATNPNFSPAVRAEALSALRDWADPPPRDRVTGFWRPLPKRDPAGVRSVVEAGLPELLAKADGSLQAEAVRLVGQLGLKADAATFAQWVADPIREVGTRAAALRLLAHRKDKRASAAIETALKDPSPQLRAEARDARAVLDPEAGTKLLLAVWNDTTAPIVERQRAVATLATLKTDGATQELNTLADRLLAGKVSAELQVDVWDALKAAPTPGRDAKRLKFESAVPFEPVGKFKMSLTGGDADRGRDVFFGHAAAQCVRCHLVNGTGGTAGPDLSKLATHYPDKTREFLLESLVKPNAKIAPGYAAVSVTLLDGKVIAGTLMEETGKTVTVQTPDGKKVTVPVDEIESRTTPTSPMPAVDKSLTHREMRDLIEYLTTLK